MKTVLISLMMICCFSQSALAERPENELPMYGGKHHPNVERNPGFSRDATQRGWKAFLQGDFDTAIKRFNQGWMFDSENPEVYWGFGVIMGQRASEGDPERCLMESVRFLEMANGKDSENGRLLGDLAFSHTVLGHFYRSQGRDEVKAAEHFATAEGLFSQAFTKDPTFPPLIANWSIFLFSIGEYRMAKSKVEEARALGFRFSPDYLMELEKHLD